MKIAIVHDYLNQYGGAERVVESLCKIFDDAPIFTSIYFPDQVSDYFKNKIVHTSFMQHIPFIKKHFKKYLFLYPIAFERLKIEDYDVVLSSSSAFGKGVKLDKNICHICYCHNPMRFVWDYDNYINLERINKILLKILPFIIKRLKKWDLKTSQRVNYFVANSNNVRNRIKNFYGRDAEVIFPPVDTNKFNISRNHEDYFLIVSRLNSYKRIELAIQAFNELKYKLKIVGEGPFKDELLKMALKDNIEFAGKVDEKELIRLYSNCRALIFPGEEDFGIVPIEAQASGRPVIAFGGGGALETVIDNVTGLFFYEQKPLALKDRILEFINIENNFDPEIIRKHALSFDEEVFKKKIIDFITSKYNDFLKNKN